MRHHIDVAFGVIEFRYICRSNGIGRRKHPVIERCVTDGNFFLNLRSFNTQRWISSDFCFCAKPFDEIGGETIVPAFIHRTDGEAVAVGEDEMAVLPGFGTTRQCGLIQFAGRDNHLLG